MFIQSQVNYIANLVEGMVILEDTNAEVICFSPHYKDSQMDDVRVATVLQHKVPQNVIDYFRLKGIYDRLKQYKGILETPAFPEIDIGPRIAFPIHWNNELVATLWFSNTSAGLVRKFEEEIAKTAADIGRLLWIASSSESRLIVELIRYLKSMIYPGFLTEGFFRDAIHRMGFDINPPYCIAVLKLVDVGNPRSNYEKKMAVHTAFHNFVEKRNLKALSGWHEEEYLILMGGPVFEKISPLEIKTGIEDIASGLKIGGLKFRAGIGSIVTDLTELPGCYEEAREAAEFASASSSPEREPEGAFLAEQLGIYGLVSLMVDNLDSLKYWKYGRSQIETLFAYDQAHSTALLDTLESYIGNLFDRKRTARQLHLHANSLDYRLKRIQEIIPLDFKNTNQQLALYVWIKTYRLAQYRNKSILSQPER